MPVMHAVFPRCYGMAGEHWSFPISILSDNAHVPCLGLVLEVVMLTCRA